MQDPVPHRRLHWLSLLMAGALLAGAAGCAHRLKIDWNSRIGTYTYDQAVIEWGPPEKSAKLTDGTTVAEWLTHRGYQRGAVSFGHPYRYGLGVYYFDVGGAPDYFLRLTFGPDNKLSAWKRVAK